MSPTFVHKQERCDNLLIAISWHLLLHSITNLVHNYFLDISWMYANFVLHENEITLYNTQIKYRKNKERAEKMEQWCNEGFDDLQYQCSKQQYLKIKITLAMRVEILISNVREEKILSCLRIAHLLIGRFLKSSTPSTRKNCAMR